MKMSVAHVIAFYGVIHIVVFFVFKSCTLKKQWNYVEDK
jgi:hypothetical protein